MKELTIEWKHLVASGSTCDRCAMTGETLRDVIKDLMPILEVNGIKATLVETALTGEDISESNLLLLNNIPLENIIPGAKVSENCCPSCSDLLGESTCCRAIEYNHQTYEDIPEFLLREGILRAAEKLIVKDKP